MHGRLLVGVLYKVATMGTRLVSRKTTMQGLGPVRFPDLVDRVFEEFGVQALDV